MRRLHEELAETGQKSGDEMQLVLFIIALADKNRDKNLLRTEVKFALHFQGKLLVPITSYPNVSAMMVIRKPKNASSFRKPVERTSHRG